MSNRIRYSVVAVAAASLVLAGCSNGQRDSDSRTDTTTSAAVSSSTTQTSSSTAATSSELQFADAYVKAKPADKSMTGIFGTIKNETKEEVTLTGFEADIDGASFEIHEVVAGKMQKKEGGITIPAGGSHELKPGADHLMVMNYDKPIQAGEDVDVKLMFSNGTTVEVPDIPVRTIASGEENYGSDGGVEGNNGMSEAPSPDAEHDHDHDHNH